jgi:polysaccharide deacetylase family protein (PEP-CTERM system associated)
MPDQVAGTSRRDLVTVAVEDYYHVGAFNHLIQRGQWYRFENRLSVGVRRSLDLLDEFGYQATFFTLGWVADQVPELIREIADRGHEVASKGYYHRSIRQMTPVEFRDDLERSREAIQGATGRPVHGYRVAHEWFTLGDLWALDVLAEAGFEYDSSIGPIFRRYASQPWRRFAHVHQFGDHTLHEFPLSSAEWAGWTVPICGGNYFRQLPGFAMRPMVDHWLTTYNAPFVLYFHTWELDPDQPHVSAAPRMQRVRQYRNLERMPDILRYYFGKSRFTSIANHLGLSIAPVDGMRRAVDAWTPGRMDASTPGRLTGTPGRLDAETPGLPDGDSVPVSVVVPCFNEELILPYLDNTLKSVSAELGSRYDLRYVFVDDRSTDDTWAALQRQFGGRDDCSFVRHEKNGGVAAAIQTGIRQAETEIVCSIDCDCSYDPHELDKMIPLLTEGVDLVVASPYHPEGGVRNVAEWRLFLSRRLSDLYRMLLHHKLYTYTSCFRVYRRSAVAGLELKERGYLGVAELVGLLDLGGSGIREFPAMLEVRMIGRSKMKVLKTIAGHLRLYGRLIVMKATLRRRDARTPRRPDATTPGHLETEAVRGAAKESSRV